MRSIVTLASGLLMTLLVGCATPTQMPLSKDSEPYQAEAGPLYLMTATFKNAYKPSYQPKVNVLHIEKVDAQDKADRLNFPMDAKARIEKDTPADGNRYLLRMQMPKGDYVVRGFSGMSTGFLIIGNFFAPLHANLPAADKGVYYLGHVNFTVRERKGNEFRAGAPIPLVDQAVTGYSGGTFDVEIVDELDKDLPELLQRFPALKSVQIEKKILPAFDREKAQKFWEAH